MHSSRNSVLSLICPVCATRMSLEATDGYHLSSLYLMKAGSIAYFPLLLELRSDSMFRLTENNGVPAELIGFFELRFLGTRERHSGDRTTELP